MEIYKKYITKTYSELAVITLLFLFFFQLLSDFIVSIYALNLIEVELNENVLALLFLLTPIILLFFKKGFPNKGFIIIGELMVICRVLQPFLMVYLKMLVTGIGLGCFMIFFPVFLQKRTKGNYEKNGIKLGVGLVIAVIASITLRTFGSSIDLSTYSWFMWIGWILAAYLALNIPQITNNIRNEKIIQTTEKMKVIPGSKWKILYLTLGMIGIITLIYLTFSSPTVLARWTGVDFILILIILLISNILFLFVHFYYPQFLHRINKWIIILWNIVFIASLVITILSNSIFFAFVNSYPLFFDSNIIGVIFLIVMLILSPIIFIDFINLSQELFRSKPSTRKLGGSYFISAGFFLIMLLSAVFTIVWDYIPLIGDLFRDMIWLVYLILGLSFFLPILLTSTNIRTFSEIKIKSPVFNNKTLSISLIFILAITSILQAFILEAPIQHDLSNASLTIVSYNIQQGTDYYANQNFDAQYEVIKNLDGDIVALQESDTCRISSGNTDIVRFINNRLKLYSYYGPRTVTGTYGIALLSKYPISNPRTFYMESKGEQTATIWAQIRVGLTVFNIFITHLGNYEDPAEDRSQIVQQENILSVISGLQNVILMGDFNFEPNTEQYNITVAQLYDCWEITPALGRTIGDVPEGWVSRLPDGRIDHIFVSEELNTTVSEILYTGGGAADHPCVYASLTGPF